MDSSGLGRNKYEMDKEPCPICSFGKVVKVSAHETVAQWEARTGKQYPDTAPVYVFSRVFEDGSLQIISETEGIGLTPEDDPYNGYGCGWHAIDFFKWIRSHPFIHPIVATEAGAPPDDWRPEEADFPQSEIVGNIHNDPELLAKKY